MEKFEMKNRFEKIDIVDVLRAYTDVKKRGNGYWCVCPFHNDNEPSISITREKGLWKCFACNEGGNVIGFVMKLKKVGYLDALKEIEKILGVDLELKRFSKYSESDMKTLNLLNLTKDMYEGNLEIEENKKIKDYLLDRKITEEQIKKFGLGFAFDKQKRMYEIAINKDNVRGVLLDKSEIFNLEDCQNTKIIRVDDKGEVWDFFKNRIMIPIFDENGNTVAFSGRTVEKDEKVKYLNSPTMDVFKKDEILYNVQYLNGFENNSAILVEGFMDLFALDSMGYKNLLATMGTAFSEKHVELLLKKKIDNLILCFDNDKAGIDATIKAGLKIHNRINVFVLKHELMTEKDFNEMLVKGKENEIKDVLKNVEHFSCFYLKHLFKSVDFSDNVKRQEVFEKGIVVIKTFGKTFLIDEYVDIFKCFSDLDSSLVKNLILSKFDSKHLTKDDIVILNKLGYNHKKKSNLAKNTIEWYEKRITYCNYSILKDVFYNRENLDFLLKLGKDYNIVNTPDGVDGCIEIIGEYYYNNPDVKSIFLEKQNDFFETYKNNKSSYVIKAIIMLNGKKGFYFNKPSFNRIRYLIMENKLNAIERNILKINERLGVDGITDEWKKYNEKQLINLLNAKTEWSFKIKNFHPEKAKREEIINDDKNK